MDYKLKISGPTEPKPISAFRNEPGSIVQDKYGRLLYVICQSNRIPTNGTVQSVDLRTSELCLMASETEVRPVQAHLEVAFNPIHEPWVDSSRRGKRYGLTNDEAS